VFVFFRYFVYLWTKQEKIERCRVDNGVTTHVDEDDVGVGRGGGGGGAGKITLLTQHMAQK